MLEFGELVPEISKQTKPKTGAPKQTTLNKVYLQCNTLSNLSKSSGISF